MKDNKSHIQKTKKTTKEKKNNPWALHKLLKTKWKENFENSQRKTTKYKGYKNDSQIKYNGLDIPNKKGMSRKDLGKSQKYTLRDALYI